MFRPDTEPTNFLKETGSWSDQVWKPDPDPQPWWNTWEARSLKMSWFSSLDWSRFLSNSYLDSDKFKNILKECKLSVILFIKCKVELQEVWGCQLFNWTGRKNFIKKFNHFVVLSHGCSSTLLTGKGILFIAYCSMVLSLDG